jgi:hypothetical protein
MGSWLAMIFGFNTDVKFGDTVYHVQSEARVGDLLLETQVFVRGRCIGKHATSYADQVTQQGFSETQIHELLKQQHRQVLEAIRFGLIQPFLAGRAVEDAGAQGLALEWVKTHGAFTDGGLRMRFVVTRAGKPVQGACVTSRLGLSPDALVHSHGITGPDGAVEIVISFRDIEDPQVAIIVQATHAGLSASRKFCLKKTGN